MSTTTETGRIEEERPEDFSHVHGDTALKTPPVKSKDGDDSEETTECLPPFCG